jgi:hypothetical protein
VAAQRADPHTDELVSCRRRRGAESVGRTHRPERQCEDNGMSTGVVVGGGPNGLAAATALAKAGVQVGVLEAADEIGGGTRLGEALLPGLLHDHCSAFHPMMGSTFLQSLELDRYGLRWRWPEIDCVHPLDGGDAGVLHRSVVSIFPPRSTNNAASAAVIAREPPAATDQYRCPAVMMPRPMAEVSGWNACAAVPPNSALAFSVANNRANAEPGSSVGTPKRASRNGCRGWRISGPMMSSANSSKPAEGRSKASRHRSPSTPSPAAVISNLADPQRSTGNVHPLWTYAHVPHGFVGASLFFALVPNWWGVTTGVVLLAATLSSADGHAEQAGPPRTASRSPPGRC